ncbi:MAG: S1C family serine protease [Pseudomonadales bacterium]|jgi:hypothetical protein|nr:S1C family serine protease [Pseudomonadales bacterium]MDP6469863.1 S1C family serine protease [Pseudomonadales bacterium]MDP6827535.1 S1C family serine protease [Pseudomonadales bacterium]MDP6971333.1 S1C family serine protease [Pseudomonadales bacterium]|tara:strand:- start:585 stop:971 length:387 start_codon:yes stop_codon:yes gene_type:complete
MEHLEDLGVMNHRIVISQGPRLVDIDEDLGAYCAVDEGVLVMKAPDDGPFRSGDIVLEIADERVISAASARATLATTAEPVKVRVRRDGKKKLEPEGGSLFAHVGAPQVKVICIEKAVVRKDAGSDKH